MSAADTRTDAQAAFEGAPDSKGKTRLDVEAAELERDFGGTQDGVIRHAAAAQVAIDRLGVSQTEYKTAMADPKRARASVRDWAELGKGFEQLDPAMTPVEAREMKAELMTDKDFFAEMKRSAKARAKWRAVIQLAAREA